MNNEEMYAPRWVSKDQEPKELFTEILPGLFMGGTDDFDTIDFSGELPRGKGNHTFDAVATMYAWARPMGWGVEEVRLGIYDGDIENSTVDRILRTALWVHERWSAGDRVLVRCQAGMNRSGLITVLAMMISGYEPDEAIRIIRSRRAPVCLFNNRFVDWLLNQAPDLVAPLQRPSVTPSAA